MAPDRLLVLLEDPGAVEAIVEAINAYQTAPQKGNVVEENLAKTFKGRPATLSKALGFARADAAKKLARVRR